MWRVEGQNGIGASVLVSSRSGCLLRDIALISTLRTISETFGVFEPSDVPVVIVFSFHEHIIMKYLLPLSPNKQKYSTFLCSAWFFLGMFSEQRLFLKNGFERHKPAAVIT